MFNLPDFFIPLGVRQQGRQVARYRAVVRTLLVVAAMATLFLPLYVGFITSATALEIGVILGCIATPIVGALIIRQTGDLFTALVTANLLGIIFGSVFAFHTGGIQSFTIPWFLSNLALLGTFGNRRFLLIIGTSVFLAFTFLIISEILGLLPETGLSETDRMIGFAISSLTALGAVIWGAYVVDKAQNKSKKRLKNALADAEEANEAKSQFLATMSHEIRTPLTGVLGMADLLSETELTGRQRNYLASIKESGGFFLEILNDILDFSRIESGNLRVESIDFRLKDVVEETVSLMRGKPETEGLSFEVSYGEGLPEGVNGDPARLRQVLLNLVGNAVKFTAMGKITVAVNLIESEAASYRFEFRVTDTGIGMSEEEIGRLFQPFTQVDSSISRQYGGSGLGLAICKRLVGLMGGTISVESVPNQGSTFIFTVLCRPLIHPLAEKTTDANHREYEATRQLDILIAEDNPLNQAILGQMLSSLGHQVELAEDGGQAVELVKKGNYDLIVMDIRMPGVSGPEATRTIRAMRPPKRTIPIIACTADTLAEHIEQYKEEGMNEVVTKPFRKGDLLRAINRVLGEAIHVSTGIDEPAQTTKTATPSAADDADIEALLKRMESPQI